MSPPVASTAPFDDHALRELFAAGDELALATLVERIGRELYGMVLRIVHDSDSAAEIVEEVFALAWRERQALARDGMAPALWLAESCHLLARDGRVHRARVGMARVPLTPPALNGEWSRFASLAPDAGHATITRTLDRLAPEERRVLELAVIEGCTLEETARGVGLTGPEAAARLGQALRRFRTLLADSVRTGGVA
jgi:RNA polymerase sigma-70 factor (ECF subfamily)